MRLLTLEWTKAQPGVSRFIRSFILNREDAQDVLQEVALAIVDNFESYDQEHSFEGWSIGIARNMMRAHFRKVYKQWDLEMDASFDGIAEAFEAIQPKLEDRKEALRECLKRVKGDDRKILTLHYEDELKPAAIGRQIARSANHVSVILHRLRTVLKNCVEQKLNREMSS